LDSEESRGVSSIVVNVHGGAFSHSNCRCYYSFYFILYYIQLYFCWRLQEKEEKTEDGVKEMEKNQKENWNSRKMVRHRCYCGMVVKDCLLVVLYKVGTGEFVRCIL
jgi:hypothetical protein